MRGNILAHTEQSGPQTELQGEEGSPRPMGLADLTSSALLEHPLVKLDLLPVFFHRYFVESVTHRDI